MKFFKNVGMNILNILNEKNITQTQLADIIGVSKQVMSKIIKGQKSINILELTRISDALGTSLERLIEEDKQSSQEPIPMMFMGNFENDKTREKINFLQMTISEIIQMEELLNE